MKLYPDVPARRNRTIVADVLTVVGLLFAAWCGKWVYEAVSELAVLGTGVRDAGTVIEGGFSSAADAVDGVPLVGGRVADGLREAGEGSGGELADLGQSGVDRVDDLALTLGLTTFLLPALLLLYVAIPRRLRQIRRLSAASAILAGAAGEEHRALLAQRAAFGPPYVALLPHTRDPLGDLEAGRLEPLIAAALDEAGVRPPHLAARVDGG